MIEVPEFVPVKVPDALLIPCPVADRPKRGATWQDVFAIMDEKHRQQQLCNDRFQLIREWQDAPRNIRPEDE